MSWYEQLKHYHNNTEHFDLDQKILCQDLHIFTFNTNPNLYIIESLFDHLRIHLN